MSTPQPRQKPVRVPPLLWGNRKVAVSSQTRPADLPLSPRSLRAHTVRFLDLQQLGSSKSRRPRTQRGYEQIPRRQIEACFLVRSSVRERFFVMWG